MLSTAAAAAAVVFRRPRSSIQQTRAPVPAAGLHRSTSPVVALLVSTALRRHCAFGAVAGVTTGGPVRPSALDRRSGIALPGMTLPGVRHYACGRSQAYVPDPIDTAPSFEMSSLSGPEQVELRRCLDGVHLRMLTPPGLSTRNGQALARGFVRMFFKDLIEQHPDHSEFAGELVVAASPAVAGAKKGSDYLMWFNKGARQHPHFHPGDRYLVIFAPAGLKVLLGGSDPAVLAQDKVHFARVAIPPGIAVLSFAKRDVLHGFMGADEEGFGAISHHSDDLGEVIEKLKVRCADSGEALQHKDLMGSLTEYVPPEKVAVIGDRDIPARVVQDLVAQRERAHPPG